MSVQILSIQPADQSTGVILQAMIVVQFDQEIDTTTFSEQTFLLSGPGTAGITTPLNMIENQPATSGVEYVSGTFSFATDSQGRTVASFRPNQPLRPNVTYTILITGVEGLSGAGLDSSYTASFTTGILNLKTPPPQCPLPGMVGRIRPGDIKVTPSSTIDNDLHRIVLTFPADIDPASFDPMAIQVGIAAFLEDPDVTVPVPTSKTITVEGNQLIIELTFPGDVACR